MPIKPSTALKNGSLITNKGETDRVYMSIDSYEEREKMLVHRASVLAAEAARLAGVPTLTQEDLDEQVKALLNGYKV